MKVDESVCMVLGNCEYYDDAEKNTEFLEESGVILLVTLGTGTWRPPMRFLRRNEIVTIYFI